MREKDLKVPPYSEETERAVLACIIMDAYKNFPLAVNVYKFRSESFYLPAHSILFGRIQKMLKAGRRVDLALLSDALVKSGEMDTIGGFGALENIFDGAATDSFYGDYCREVREKWCRRMAIAAAREIEMECFHGAEDGDEVLKKSPARFFDAIEEVRHTESPADLCLSSIDTWAKARDEGRPVCDMPTPWKSLNDCIIGWEPGMTIVAARPSEGKSVIEDMSAQFSLERGKRVARVLLDMPKRDSMDRLACRMAGVSLFKAKAGYMYAKQEAALREAAERIREFDMHILGQDDRINTLDGIGSWIRGLHYRYGLDMVTVDYVQQVKTGDMKVDGNEYARVTAASGYFHDLAAELGIPIMVLSQLSRPDKKKKVAPELGDLRGSGYLEQDASKVIFIHRAYNFEEDNDNNLRACWLCVKKQQNGGLISLPMVMLKNYFSLVPAQDRHWWESYDEASPPDLRVYLNDSGNEPAAQEVEELFSEDNLVV